MKVLLVTQFYPPEVGAAAIRMAAWADGLQKHGCDVEVVTAMPNYPTGKIFEGFGGLVRQERHDGIKIIRTGIYPTQKTSFLHRLANYFSFVISSAFFGTFLLARTDYLLVESPPLFLGFSGYWLSRIKRTRSASNVSFLSSQPLRPRKENSNHESSRHRSGRACAERRFRRIRRSR